MADHKIFSMSFSRIYRLYTDKVEKKGRTEDELKDVIRWLTGYAGASLEEVIAGEKDMAAFFSEAPDSIRRGDLSPDVYAAYGWRR